MPPPSSWFEHVLREHIGGTRPPPALVQRTAQEFIYGSKTYADAKKDKPNDTAPNK